MRQAAPEEPEAVASGATCHRCGKGLSQGRAFSFRPRTPPQEGSPVAGEAIIRCFPCALRHRPMLKRSMVAAFLVGTVLTLLNQGDALLAGQWSNALYWKIPLTYCVPFIVATYGALTNSRQ